MKRIFKNLSYLILFGGTCATCVHAQTQPSLPHVVIDEIVRMEEECYLENDNSNASYATKKPLKTDLNVVQQVDINDDGIPDYIINDGQIACEMGYSARHGNGGTGVLIFAGTPDGAVKAFDKTVFGIYVEGEGPKSVAWIAVGGHYCGQETFVSRAAAISCDRPLVWNTASKQFDFAPLKQARFPTKL